MKLNVSCAESKLVFDFLDIASRRTLLDTKSESHVPRSYYLIIHW